MRNLTSPILIFPAVLAALCLLFGCGDPQTPARSSNRPDIPDTPDTREITDMAGRTVIVPTEIDSVFSTGPASAIILYMAAPDKLLGWNYELNETEKSVILEEYHDLPNFGMGDAVNYEAVIAADPAIALNCGTIDEAMIADCDALEKTLGIPVVAVDSDLNNSAAAFRFLGELLGVREHTDALASYAEELFDDIASLKSIPEEKKLRVYYGNGEDSLETAPDGSSHAGILDTINAVNVADLELGDGSRVQISAEQLLAWDPDIILVNGEPKANMSGGSAAKAILEHPDYAALKAVQEQKVYGIPNAPFGWVDRPAGPNRLIGIRYFASIIYAEHMNWDMEEEIREFFKLFYHVDMTDEQLQHLLAGTLTSAH
ncbi:MAG: ABC transporter substrate-binding protein [Lachnospiraceae bacterium]|nr:ABC transporter substrate-binding protein [Lachnospiraceae bacterium]